MQVAGLQTLSSYSLLQSPIKINQLVKDAQEKGYDSIALTDINVTYGLVDFYLAAKKQGIKPLLGMTIRINGLIDPAKKYDLLTIAKNQQGYQNILRLSSAINLITENGQNDKVLTLKQLDKYLSHQFFIVPANDRSELRSLSETSPNLASDFVREISNLIPSTSSLYLGVYGAKGQTYLDFVSSMAKQFNLPLVATEDVRYLNPQDQFLTKTLGAIANNVKLHPLVELAQERGSHYLRSSTELSVSYRNLNLETALFNAAKIATEANSEVEFVQPQLPKYHQDKFASSQAYLRHLAEIGLASRFKSGKIPQPYQERLDYELKVINEMGFDDYFLIVWDVINYAHSVDITTGPGRGSAAGSLVAYSLRITEVDPLRYHLLFERFLNPSRKQMPDIDLDIPDNRRDEVIKYMFTKYGMDHAAQILTFGTLAAKQAIRDCGRVFGLAKTQIDKWTRAIPFKKTKITLQEAYQESEKMRLLVNATEVNKLMFKTALALEDLPRHYSIHAAGLVISDKSIAKISGLQAGVNEIPVTQQTKKHVEELGLLKIDFLGLRNLTILGNTLKILSQDGIKLDPKLINLQDTKTLALFQAGETDAIFQFESAGIQGVLRRLHPDDFEDVVAVNALYRPGPIKNIDHFINRKLGKEPVTYPDSSLEAILKPTYGILVYQEQVMQTAQILAGFSLGEADNLRRAMSKKDQAVIEKERSKFISGAIEKGHSKQQAEIIYNYIEQFANYGFNRSHAVAYSKVAFWLAYLKVHFPAAFYTALLNSNLANREKLAEYIRQAQKYGVKVHHPDINQSQVDFTLQKGELWTGLKAIKGVRIDFLRNIVANRPYKSLVDFLRKIDTKFLNAQAICALIKGGCFDKIDANRSELLYNCEDIVENVKFTGQNITLSEGLGGIRMVEKEAPTKSQKAEMEEEVLGFSTTQTALVAVQKYAKRFNTRDLTSYQVNETGISVGRLIKLKQIRTKKGDTMAFAQFTDAISTIEVTIFPGVYKKFAEILKEGQIYLLGLRTTNDRYDASKVQYFLTNLKQVNFKE
ncbi:DNA polymerase III subunit alpha [Lactobacillus psittaci]|uniref:DNA-directed DNA polymerase n=1 Tax=Lactobacillus psittaci DSM 15354 TaxID=1122152 RepID=A0A0R1SAC4_9LACO|nr:DNA polymerase III subunit alpha [Lactobacillus psittaci]KRL63554.1 DNA polymerase III alpha-chain [Lactobacillus psittaci DSM 15354]